MEQMNDWEQNILTYLSVQKKAQPSTYRIAKDTGIDWTTTYVNCCHLVSRGFIDTKYINHAVTSRSKQVWFISRNGEEYMIKENDLK